MAVQYTEEVASRAQAWLANSHSKRRTRENIAELHALYALITGGSAEGCTSCNFQGYVDLLTAYVTHFQRLSNPELMAKSAYTLAPGYENETFVHESYAKAITADTITDEAAEFFIGKGFRHAFLKNGKPLEEEAAAPERKLSPKQQAVADYKELFQADPDEKLTEVQLKEAIKAKREELSQQD